MFYVLGVAGVWSLSARRAWIEICKLKRFGLRQRVALRKESVDRNRRVRVVQQGLEGSLSARRAWIEIEFMPLI